MSFALNDSLLGEDSFPVGRLGAQYERSFRILTFLLSAWCDNAGNRVADDKRTYCENGERGLSIIAFDKLAVLSYRIWNRLWDLRGHNVVDDGGKNVSFPYPFREIPGRHGRGLGLHDWHPVTKKPGYLPQILIKMAKEGTQRYLSFKNLRLAAVTDIDDTIEISSYNILVNPGLPTSSMNNMLKGMNEYEKSILRDLENALKRLNNHQIRVLGTHSQPDKTIQDIKILLHKWRVLRDNFLNNNDGEIEKILHDVREWKWCADEMWRKASDNREVYKVARNNICREFTHPDIKQAFQLVQGSEQHIWESDDEMELLKDIAAKAKTVSEFVYKHSKNIEVLPTDCLENIKSVKLL